jgi:dipeptidyl aminopeptidase/acylaminoacyl peptidase
VANAVGVGYSPMGYLLYTDKAGGLFAMGFDPDRLQATSAAIPLIDDVAPGGFVASASGDALYTVKAAPQAAELTWVARDGTAQPLDSTWHGDFQYPALSPDGKALAVSLTEATTQLWIRRSDGTRQKLTQEGSVNWRPAWTPDGRSLGFSSRRPVKESQDEFGYYQAQADGSGGAQLLARHRFGVSEGVISPDGRWLVVRAGENQILMRRLDGDTTLMPVRVDKTTRTQISFSPDGHWIAYRSDATGRSEIYVAPFPAGTPERLVSREGGAEPRWAHSGRELFYRSGRQLMSVAVTPGPTLVLDSPRPLFSVAQYRSGANHQQYDVAPDDRHFVMIRQISDPASRGIVYMENWSEELRAKVKR